VRLYTKLGSGLVLLAVLTLSSCSGVGSNRPSVPAPPSSVQLTVSKTGAGAVTSNPAGINCGSTCTASFNSGTTVTLTATPSAGSVFAGWSGACSGTGPCSLTLSAATSTAATFNAAVTGSLQSINHIIFMAQENRGFLQYFGALPQYWANSNGQYSMEKFDGLPQFNAPPGPVPSIPGCDPTLPPPNLCSYDPNNAVQSYHAVNKCTEGLSPWWNQSHHDFNYNDPLSTTPTLDGYVIMAANFARKHPNYNDVNGIRSMGYYTGDDLNYYYFMASNFATSDRWFSPTLSDTATNRMYLLAATSSGRVRQRPATDGLSNDQTIFEALQKAGISWKVYVSDPNPTLIAGSAMSQYSFTYNANAQQNFVPAAQFKTDAVNGTLPQVAMIEPGYIDGTDEHPFDNALAPGGSVQAGARYVSGLINTLMTSQSWKDSAFILTFDEFGGFYDNVPPQPAVSPDGISPIDLQPGDGCYGGSTSPTCNFMYTGYRVPLIVVSPFTKRHYVSHTVADFTAILKFIETRFNVSNLTARDAAQMDMTEVFDFTNPPWMTPPSPPAQVVTGPCDNAVP